MSVAGELVRTFERIAATDGGALSVVGEDASLITLAYKPGQPADCEDGICAMPQSELEAMMQAWLARKAPHLTLKVERLPDSA